MATTATPWCGNSSNKLYLQSGQFTSTIKTSQIVITIDWTPRGISWDGTNTPWIGDQYDKLFLQSGQFTSTVKTSQVVGGVPTGISFDGQNTPHSDWSAHKLILTSGQFSSTIKTSQITTATYVDDISYDGENTPWTDYASKLYLQSGQFTSTIKTSQNIGGIDNVARGISWDGTNTPWCGAQANKLYLQSGQFTSTLKTSEDVSAKDSEINGICTDDYSSRLGGLFIRSVSDSLTLTDQVVDTIIRIPLNVQHISDSLIFTEEAGYYIGKLEPSDTLSFTQDITISNSHLRVADVLVFVEIARQPITYEKLASDTLTFTESITYSSNNYVFSDSLYFEEFVDLRGDAYRIGRDVIDILTFTDSATADIHFYAFHITDNLNFQQSVTTLFPINRSVTDTLVFDDSLTVRQPHNKSVIEYFDWTYNSDGHPSTPRPSFEERVDRQLIANRRGHQTLIFNQTVQVVKEISGAISKSVSDALVFTQSAARVYGGISTLTFTQAVSVDLCKSGKDTLTFTQAVGYSHKTSHDVSDVLILESTVAYDIITSDILCQYHPFIGGSTVSDAPSPPHQTPRTIVKYDNIQLFYPTDNPTETITLRGPEFDDRDQLHFSRINRETRGGTLVVFSDPIWPQNQRLLLSFVGLSETEAQNTLTFIEATVGKQIGLRDWEGKEWAGIILTPSNPITRNHNCNIGFDIEFEGVPVLRNNISNILTFNQIVVDTLN